MAWIENVCVLLTVRRTRRGLSRVLVDVSEIVRLTGEEKWKYSGRDIVWRG